MVLELSRVNDKSHVIASTNSKELASSFFLFPQHPHCKTPDPLQHMNH
jgi:hypothetical protein